MRVFRIYCKLSDITTRELESMSELTNDENVPFGIGEAVESYQRSGNFVLEEYLPELRGLQGKRTMQAMCDDATYGAILFVLGATFRSLTWEVKIPDELVGDADAEMKREYLEHVLFHDIGDATQLDSFMTFDDLVSMIVQTMFPWGYCLINPVLKKRSDGLVGIGRLIEIHPMTVYGWDIEEPTGYVNGVLQERPYSFGIKTIHRDNFLHFRTEPWKGSPEGVSLFRRSYKSYYRREKLQTLESILAERGTGFPVITADAQLKRDALAGDEYAKFTCAQLEKMPSQVRMNERSGMTLYTDYFKDSAGNPTNIPRVKFEFAPPGQSNNVDFRTAIRDFDMAISRSVMGQFMFNGSESGGSRAMDISQTNTFMKAINGFAEIIAGGINRQLVETLWRHNGWAEDEYRPYVAAGSIDKADLKEVGAFIQNMASAGAPIFPNEETTSYLMSLAGIPYEPQGSGEM